MAVFVPCPSLSRVHDHCFPGALIRAARLAPTPPPPPSAAILRTLTSMVAHFFGAFPPLQRTHLVAAIKSRVNLRQNKTGSFELCTLVITVGLRSGYGDIIFSSGGWFLFSFSSFERSLWLWGGELEPWASLRLGRLPWRTRAGAAQLSRSGPWRGPPAADAAASADPRAPSALGAAGTRGRGRGGSRLTPRSVLPRVCTCALEVSPRY